jgi:hypothetical protein
MKKSLITTCSILLSFICVSAFGQSKTEELIMKLSKEKNTYLNPRSVDKIKPILDERLVFIHSNGLTETKAEMLKNLADAKYEVLSADINEMSVRVFKNDLAIVIGKGIFHSIAAGKKTDTELYFTEVWTHFKKGWQLVSRHASKILPPQ